MASITAPRAPTSRYRAPDPPRHFPPQPPTWAESVRDFRGPPPLSHFVLPRSGWGNGVVCLGQWRDSNAKCSSYDQLAMQVGSMLSIEDVVRGREVEKLLDITTFYEAEKAILSGLRDRVIATADAEEGGDAPDIDPPGGEQNSLGGHIECRVLHQDSGHLSRR